MVQADDGIFQATAEYQHDKVLAAKDKKHGEAMPTFTVGTAVDPAGVVFPTEEERHTLRRVPGKITFRTFTIGFIELCERFGYYGSQVVMTNFIQWPLPDGPGTIHATGAGGDNGQSGALGMGQRASTGLTTFFSFFCYLTPLLGAYMADTYWGRYKTICICVGIAVLGHIILTVSAIPGVINHQGGALACFIVAILVFGLGTGGFKSNISPLIAEQYTTERLTVVTRKNGERVIVDPALTSARVFNYYYLLINVGALIGQIAMAYAERYIGFWLSFLLPTCIFLLCPLVLWWGNNKYVKVPPQGSVLPDAVRVWRYSSKGAWSINPLKTARNWDWTRAYPSKHQGENKPKWMNHIVTDLQVDEIKRGFAACKVFLYVPLWFITYNQINNNLVSQAAALHYGVIPNDVLSNLDPFALILFIPIFDLVIYPALRKVGIDFTPLKRIAFGFFTGSAAMICAAVVQHFIYTTSECGYDAGSCSQGSDLSVWIQTPSYVLIATSEIFTSITCLEYAFTKAPRNARSLVTSIFLLMQAIGNAITLAFVSLSSDPLLVANYATMAGLAFAGGCLFWLNFRHLDKQEHDLNELADRAAARNDGSYTGTKRFQTAQVGEK